MTKEPAPWLNPLAAVPKTNDQNKIRLNIDMQNANTTISRTRFPTPTIEDLNEKLRHATKFAQVY